MNDWNITASTNEADWFWGDGSDVDKALKHYARKGHLDYFSFDIGGGAMWQKDWVELYIAYDEGDNDHGGPIRADHYYYIKITDIDVVMPDMAVNPGDPVITVKWEWAKRTGDTNPCENLDENGYPNGLSWTAGANIVSNTQPDEIDDVSQVKKWNKTLENKVTAQFKDIQSWNAFPLIDDITSGLDQTMGPYWLVIAKWGLVMEALRENEGKCAGCESCECPDLFWHHAFNTRGCDMYPCRYLNYPIVANNTNCFDDPDGAWEDVRVAHGKNYRTQCNCMTRDCRGF